MFDPAPRSESNLDAVPEALQDWQVPDPPPEYPLFHEPAPPARSRNIPSLAHTFLFFALAIVILMLGEIITVGIGHHLPPFRHEDFTALAGDPRLMIPAQALQYLVLLGLTAMIFGALWNAPFWRTLRWNASAAARHWIALIGIGLLLGLGSSLAGNYLPMPKEAPILNDLMNSTLGAWLMFLFGTTGAPLIEELAFRGFLLPSLINGFRSLERSRQISHTTMALLGVPLSILLTSLPFALLHSLQVSYAWAPVLLIALVSIALCVVRLWTNSLAASTLVHATYNFSLFAGMLIASDGFRHLEKLNS